MAFRIWCEKIYLILERFKLPFRRWIYLKTNTIVVAEVIINYTMPEFDFDLGQFYVT